MQDPSTFAHFVAQEMGLPLEDIRVQEAVASKHGYLVRVVRRHSAAMYHSAIVCEELNFIMNVMRPRANASASYSVSMQGSMPQATLPVLRGMLDIVEFEASMMSPHMGGTFLHVKDFVRTL